MVMHMLQNRRQTDQSAIPPLARLRQQWMLVGLLAGGLVFGGFLLLRGLWGATLAGRWALAAAPTIF